MTDPTPIGRSARPPYDAASMSPTPIPSPPRRISQLVAGVRIKFSVTEEEGGGTRISLRVVIPPRA